MTHKNKYAIWGITPNSITLIRQIISASDQMDIYLSSRICSSLTQSDGTKNIFCFDSLRTKLAEVFHSYDGHILIMATGIAVRMISPLIVSKTTDPAVVVVDDRGQFAISLLSGHLGGANELAEKTAGIIGAQPVITTATDINNVPSIDVIAKASEFVIENPRAIKTISMAFLNKQPVSMFDPYGILKHKLPSVCVSLISDFRSLISEPDMYAGIYISDEIRDLPENVLILRPRTLVAGIGCNRNTGMDEMKTVLGNVMKTAGLAFESLKNLASIDIKQDETGLIELSEYLRLPVDFYSKEVLNKVKNIQTPSSMVKKHIGVYSVCEAAAMISAQTDNVLVPKQKSGNVTIALARIPSALSD